MASPAHSFAPCGNSEHECQTASVGPFPGPVLSLNHTVSHTPELA